MEREQVASDVSGNMAVALFLIDKLYCGTDTAKFVTRDSLRELAFQLIQIAKKQNIAIEGVVDTLTAPGRVLFLKVVSNS